MESFSFFIDCHVHSVLSVVPVWLTYRKVLEWLVMLETIPYYFTVLWWLLKLCIWCRIGCPLGFPLRFACYNGFLGHGA